MKKSHRFQFFPNRYFTIYFFQKVLKHLHKYTDFDIDFSRENTQYSQHTPQEADFL